MYMHIHELSKLCRHVHDPKTKREKSHTKKQNIGEPVIKKTENF